MPTVKQLRKRGEQDLRHAPNVKDHREEWLDRLNEAQERLYMQELWSFRMRTHTLRLKADVALTSASYTGNPTTTVPPSVEVGVTSPSEAVNRCFSFPKPSAWDADDVVLLEGQVAEITGNTSATANGRWVIERAWIASGYAFIILDPRFPSGAAATLDGTITLKHARYKLPIDAANVLHIAMRSSEDWLLQETPFNVESRLLLKEDDAAGVPRTYVISPNYADAYELRNGNSYRHDFVQAPMEAPTVASAADGSGSLTAGEKYEYRYAWKVAGIVSEASPIAEVTIAAQHDSVAISGLEVQGASTNILGREKIIYRRRIYADHEGPWYAVSATYSYDADVTDLGTFDWPGVDPTARTRQRQYTYGGSHKWIRVWPTPDADYDGELHYYSRPPLLDGESDVPVLPREMHIGLVHLVVQDLAGSDEDSLRVASMAQSKLYNDTDGVITMARRNYLGHHGVRLQKRGVLMNVGGEMDIMITQPTWSE